MMEDGDLMEPRSLDPFLRHSLLVLGLPLSLISKYFLWGSFVHLIKAHLELVHTQNLQSSLRFHECLQYWKI